MSLPYKIATLLYVFNERDEVLLLERAQEPNRGLWSPGGGKLNQRPFGAIGRPDAHPVPGLDAKVEKARRNPVDHRIELRPGPAQTLMARYEGDTIGPARRRKAQRRADGGIEQGNRNRPPRIGKPAHRSGQNFTPAVTPYIRGLPMWL